LGVRRDVFVNRSEESEEREFTLWERRRAKPRERRRRFRRGWLEGVEMGPGAEESVAIGWKVALRH
jgi:hypothetical protein